MTVVIMTIIIRILTILTSFISIAAAKTMTIIMVAIMYRKKTSDANNA